MTDVWSVALVALVVTQTSVVATSVYLHRTLAHRALAVHRVADLLFRTVLWLTTGQRRQEWVAVHRKHHAFTDREGDPARRSSARRVDCPPSAERCSEP